MKLLQIVQRTKKSQNVDFSVKNAKKTKLLQTYFFQPCSELPRPFHHLNTDNLSRSCSFLYPLVSEDMYPPAYAHLVSSDHNWLCNGETRIIP